MTSLASLWLPILLSAVVVFIASSIIHMGPLWHRTDYPRMPDEDRVRAALGPLAIPPGDYMVPRPANAAELQSPGYLEKLRQGPVMVVTVLPNEPASMARSLSLWFVYLLLVSWLAAYVTGRALPPGAAYLRVFQIAATTAFIGYAAALWQMSIWYRRAWSTTLKATVDGLIYALLAAGVFGWLWP
jgi:hypothetical protein